MQVAPEGSVVLDTNGSFLASTLAALNNVLRHIDMKVHGMSVHEAAQSACPCFSLFGVQGS
jgi:hypothetical protein